MHWKITFKMNKPDFFYSNFLILFLFIPFLQIHSSQDDGWEFKKDKYGIKVYTRDVGGTNLKELMFTTSINSTMNQAVALLVDVPSYSQWVYGCDHAGSLKEETNLQSFCYYKMDFPWPMTDRDLVVYSNITQDPETKIVTSETSSRADYMEEADGYIRVQKHFNKWIFKPVSPTEIEITYYLKSNPAGSVPSWLVNMVIDQGPVKSMNAFKERLQTNIYKNAKVEGIENF